MKLKHFPNTSTKIEIHVIRGCIQQKETAQLGNETHYHSRRQIEAHECPTGVVFCLTKKAKKTKKKQLQSQRCGLLVNLKSLSTLGAHKMFMTCIIQKLFTWESWHQIVASPRSTNPTSRFFYFNDHLKVFLQ